MENFSAMDFSPDSQWLYYTANDAGEFTELRRVNLATQQHESVRKADWDVTDAFFSQNGKYLVSAINDDGTTRVLLTDTASG